MLHGDIVEINHAQRAFKAWSVLTDCATKGKTITYAGLGAAIGIHHRPIRYVLGLIQDHCIAEGLPPLTILVVNQKGLPGSGFIAYNVDRFEEGRQSVYSRDWSTVENPFQYASDGHKYGEIVTTLATNPDASGEVMRLVKSRGMAQVMFRDALLKCYENSCAFTGLTFPEALEACHIVPWSSCSIEQRIDVRNGVLLNSLHHRLFDRGWITITEDHRIWFSDPQMEAEPYSTFDRSVSVDLHNKKMRLPRNIALSPSPELLRESHRIHEWEGTVG
ncbi:HNH endonuclease [Stutzerimonas frequens]|nr:HNH endonuclease [Stutzerimonas frequens]TDL96892.1 HNH endonuclease [Stutzerimonas stutzeri ATCC 17588 = LMG 11199]